MNILKFNDFLLLEARLSKHADDRIAQRITSSIVVTFPDKVMSKIYHTGRPENKVVAETTSLIKKEFMHRLKNRIERPDFADDSRVVVLMDVWLKIGDDQFPVTLTVTSFDEGKDGKIKEKELYKFGRLATQKETDDFFNKNKCIYIWVALVAHYLLKTY